MIVFTASSYPGFFNLEVSHPKHGRPKLKRLNFMRAALAASLVIALIVIVSCDERNEADKPDVVYSLKHTIVTSGAALDLAASGDVLAIAASSAGTLVFDISNPVAPDTLMWYQQIPPFYSALVALDTVNNLVATISNPAAPGDRFPIHYYETGRRVTFASFSGPFEEIMFQSKLDTFSLWGTDGTDGLVAGNYCHSGDSTWSRDCPSFWEGWNVVPVRMRGFDIKGKLLAIALADYRIHIRDTELNTNYSVFITPGDPQDCAWYGDYLLVADYLYLSIFNVEANASAPEAVTVFTIPGADRIITIKMDGDRAILLDDADGIYVVDVSDLANPKLLQTISLPEPTGLAVANGRLIATDQQLGTLIYER